MDIHTNLFGLGAPCGTSGKSGNLGLLGKSGFLGREGFFGAFGFMGFLIGMVTTNSFRYCKVQVCLFTLLYSIMTQNNKQKTEEDSVSKAHRTIISELDKIHGRKKWSHTNCTILCPFHSERTPSCGIYIVPNGKIPLGFYYCLGCGAKGGWNSIASKLGLQKISSRDNTRDRVGYSSHMLNGIKSSLVPDRVSDKLEDVLDKEGFSFTMDYDRPLWRGISRNMVKDVGGVISVDLKAQVRETVLVLPVMVRKKCVALIKAKIDKRDGEIGYVLTENTHIKDKGLFPFDYVKNMVSTGNYKWIVLVEGQRDALRLLEYGVPALSILGVKLWSEKKQRLLMSLGLNVVVAMDGDKAGRLATKSIAPGLRKITSVKVLKLSSETKRLGTKVDPGNMSVFFIKQLQALNKETKDLIGKRLPRYRRKADA